MATVTISSYTSGSGTTGIGTASSTVTKSIIEPTTIPLFSTINSIKVSFTHTTAKGALTAGSVTGSRWAYLQTDSSYPDISGSWYGMSSGSALNSMSHGNGTLHAGHFISKFDFDAKVSSSATYVKTNKVENLKVTYDYTPPAHTIKLATRKGQTGTDDNFNPTYSNRLFTGVDNGDGTATITLNTSTVKYTDYVFDCWEDGSTDPTRTISLGADATFVAIYRPKRYFVNYYDCTSGEDVLIEQQVCDCDATYTTPALPVYSGSIPEGYGVNPTGWVLNKDGNIRDNGYMYQNNLTTVITQYTTFSKLASTDGAIINFYFGLFPRQYSVTYTSYLRNTLEEKTTTTAYRLFGGGDYSLINLPTPTTGYKLTNKILENGTLDDTIMNNWFISSENMGNSTEETKNLIESNYAEDIVLYSYETPINYTVNYYNLIEDLDQPYFTQICNYDEAYAMPDLPIYENNIVGYTANPIGWTQAERGNVRNGTTTMYVEGSTSEVLNQYVDFSNLTTEEGDVFNYYFNLHPIQYSITYHNLKEKTLEGPSFVEHRIFDAGDYNLSNLPEEITTGYKLTNQMANIGDAADPTITNSWFTSLENLSPQDQKITYIESTFANNIDLYSYETPNTYIVDYYDFTSGEDVLVERQICECYITYDMPQLPVYENSTIGYATNPIGWVTEKIGSIRIDTSTMFAEKSTENILEQYNSFLNLSFEDGVIFNYYFGLYPIQYEVNYKNFVKNSLTEYTTKTEYRIYDNGNYILSTLPTTLTPGYKLTNKMSAFGDKENEDLQNYWFTSTDNLNPDSLKITEIGSQVANNITVYSYETPIDYTVYFHICDYDTNELSVSYITTKYEEELTTPEKTEEKEGRVLFGWYNGSQDIDTWCVPINSNSSITGGAISTSLNFNYLTKNLTTEDNSEIHYYAYYISKAYSITYQWLDSWSLNSSKYSLPITASRIYGKTNYTIPTIPNYDNYIIDNVETIKWYYFDNDDKETEQKSNEEENLSLFLTENRIFYANKYPKPRYVNFQSNNSTLGGVFINKSENNGDGYLEGSTLEVYANPTETSSFQTWGDNSKTPIKIIKIGDSDLEYNINFRDESKSVGIIDLYKGNTQIKGVFQKDNLIFQNAELPKSYREPTYSFTNLNSTYPFTYNSNTGYYVSGNKGVHNSYSLCQIDVTTTTPAIMYVDCISYGESGYDYGILSNLNKELGKNYNAVSTTSDIVKHTFYQKSSSAVQTVQYNLEKNSNVFIQIKYRKDGSQNSNNDTLQFKIRFAEIT